MATPDEEIEIYRRRWARKHFGRVSNGLEGALECEVPWVVGLDAREYLSVAADFVAANMYLAIMTNTVSHTGARRTPDRRGDPRRMIRDGKFVQTITRSKVSGTVDRAKCTIKPAKGRKLSIVRLSGKGANRQGTVQNLGVYEAALLNEATQRDQLYFRMVGRNLEAMREGCDDYLQAQLRKQVRPVSIGSRKAHEIVATRASQMTRGI